VAGFPANVANPQLEDVPANSAAATAGLQTGDIVLEVSGRPAQVSALPDMQYRVMYRGEAVDASQAENIVISRNGEVMTLPIAEATTADELVRDSRYTPVLGTEIMATAPDSPAEMAGLEAGDKVYAVNGTVISSTGDSLVELIKALAGEEVALTVLRDNQWQTLNITPRVDPPPGEGALGVQIASQSTMATLPPLRALWEGVRETFTYVSLVLQLPFMLIAGTLSPAEAQISGPVGIAQMVGGAMSATLDTGLLFPILRLTAILSAALAITNMLPLPALDGGRLLFILIETLRGRRVNPEREGMVHIVGFMLLLGLLVIVTVQDIRNAPEAIDWLSMLGQ
jgi:regulator of sigma E protease